ncbi:hypothetical protein LEN26_014936 [Aphanomyces euteiches]|nr:hypothetical protein LEN26_014936 [Aphanomyces euteiches]
MRVGRTTLLAGIPLLLQAQQPPQTTTLTPAPTTTTIQPTAAPITTPVTTPVTTPTTTPVTTAQTTAPTPTATQLPLCSSYCIFEGNNNPCGSIVQTVKACSAGPTFLVQCGPTTCRVDPAARGPVNFTATNASQVEAICGVNATTAFCRPAVLSAPNPTATTEAPETLAKSPSTPGTLTPSSSSSQESSSSHTGAIVGGIVGVLAVALIGFVFVKHRNRRAAKPSDSGDDVAMIDDVEAYVVSLTPSKAKPTHGASVLSHEESLPVMDTSSFVSMDVVSQDKRSLQQILSSREDLQPLWLPLEKLDTNPLKGGQPDLRVATYNGSKVALRCLDYASASSAKRTAFFASVQRLRPLKNPHLTSLLGVSLVGHQTQACVVTEHMSKGSLGSLLLASDDLSQKQRLTLGLHIALVVQYLHGRGLVYGGLHPDKVLVNNNLEAKLNLIHLMAPVYTPRRFCNASCGRANTTAFVAPELRPIDAPWPGHSPSTDVYAVGVLIAHCVTRDQPHRAIYKAQGFVRGDAFLHQHPETKPFDITGHVSPKLQQVVESCWHVDPAARPSIDAVVTALHEAVAESELLM